MKGINMIQSRTAPSHWACWLINGDDSGISADDKAQADSWVAREGMGAPVACEDAGFFWRHDAETESPLGADCQHYTFIRKGMLNPHGEAIPQESV